MCINNLFNKILTLIYFDEKHEKTIALSENTNIPWLDQLILIKLY